MSLQLRIFLITVSLLFLIFVLRIVRTKVLLLRNSLLWLLMAAFMLVLAVFPGIAITISQIIGIETPSNFVFFVAVIMLLALLFRQTVSLSKMTVQIEKLTQKLALLELRYIEENKKN